MAPGTKHGPSARSAQADATRQLWVDPIKRGQRMETIRAAAAKRRIVWDDDMVKLYRAKIGTISQEALADEIGVSASTLRRFHQAQAR